MVHSIKIVSRKFIEISRESGLEGSNQTISTLINASYIILVKLLEKTIRIHSCDNKFVDINFDNKEYKLTAYNQIVKFMVNSEINND